MAALILSFILLSTAQAATPALPRPGSHAELTVPPAWDDDTKSVQTPEFLTVQAAGSIETCTFHGGQVAVKKVSAGQVYFDPIPSLKGACAHLVTSAENFRGWLPGAVKAQKDAWEKKASAFHKQLMEDVNAIVEKGGDPCANQDKELKTGNVYKVTGRVYLYGRGTTAVPVGDKAVGSCQVELGSFVEILGFNRASDHAVAVYHRPEGSSGEVLAGPRHDKTETCRDGKPVVFSLSKLKEHFHFAKPSTRENLEVKGIVAVLGAHPKSCINVTEQRSDASGEHARKLGRTTGSDEEERSAPVDGQPGIGGSAQ